LAEVAGGSRGTTRRSVWRTSEFHLAETWLWSHREEKLEASSRTHEAQPPPPLRRYFRLEGANGAPEGRVVITQRQCGAQYNLACK
jgi:hypothetical protein